METMKRPNYVEELLEIFRSPLNKEELLDKISDYHENDIAEAFEHLTEEERKKLYPLLGAERMAEIFTYIEEPDEYLKELNLNQVAQVISHMDSDDAVDVLDELDDLIQEKLVGLMDEESSHDIKMIQSYEDDEIGSQMTTNFIMIHKNLSIRQAMRELVRQAGENDNIGTVYVEDGQNHFYGAIDLKDLIVARENDSLEDIISTSYPYVTDHEKISDCIERIKDYAEDSIPVLDSEGQILGVITSQDIVEVLDEVPEMQDKADAVKNVADGSIDFNHVDFSYAGEGGNLSLKDINLHIKSGQTVGIIGGTGSGKSSLVNMIARFYDATEGEVKINGRNVKEYNIESLRNHVAVVMQKALLFKGSIRDNMKWGKKDATDDEIMEALDISQSREFVEKKDGKLDAFIDQGGKNLSGGQRQRLTIARAMVRKPDILILDDSASALDFATDAALRKAIRGMKSSPTLFIVSQRAASLMHADKIIVLDDGKVAGIGTHDELLAGCEVYQEIYYSQFKKEAM